jgi:hypothetical protein
MVTGDNVETAKAIAVECGILNANDVESETIVIEGKVFREMSESAREEVADKITVSPPLHPSLYLVFGASKTMKFGNINTRLTQ